MSLESHIQSLLFWAWANNFDPDGQLRKERGCPEADLETLRAMDKTPIDYTAPWNWKCPIIGTKRKREHLLSTQVQNEGTVDDVSLTLQCLHPQDGVTNKWQAVLQSVSMETQGATSPPKFFNLENYGKNMRRLLDEIRDLRMHIDAEKAVLATAKKQRDAHAITLGERERDYKKLEAKLNALTRVQEQNKKLEADKVSLRDTLQKSQDECGDLRIKVATQSVSQNEKVQLKAQLDKSTKDFAEQQQLYQKEQEKTTMGIARYEKLEKDKSHLQEQLTDAENRIGFLEEENDKLACVQSNTNLIQSQISVREEELRVLRAKYEDLELEHVRIKNLNKAFFKGSSYKDATTDDQ